MVIFDVWRCAVLDQPSDKSRIELLFYSVVQCRSAFLILEIHIRALESEEFGCFEFSPAPAPEERRRRLFPLTHDDINRGPGTNQQIEVLEVFPPTCREQS